MFHHRPLRGGGGGTKHAGAGRVVASGKKHRDDNGDFEPLGATFFPFYWGWKNDQARTKQNAEYIAPWTEFFRTLGEVGGVSWEDRTVDPRDADYVDTWKAILDYCWHTLNTRIMFTIFGGGTGANPDMVVDKVIEILRDRLDAIMSVEICNEGNGVDRDTARRLAQKIQAAFPGLLVATTSDTDATAHAQLDLDVASAGETHTERDKGDEDWRQVRQGCELMGLPKSKGGTEPPGPHSSVAELWDPLRLACLRRVHTFSGTTRWVLHLGAGVRLGGQADLARGRFANFWDYDKDGLPAKLSDIVKALRANDGLMPMDAANWQPMKGHWADTRVVADMIWSDNAAAFDHGCVRVYGSYTGDQFVDMAFGIRRYVMLTIKFGPWNLKLYDMQDGSLIEERHVNDGETFRVEGDPTGGSNKAVLLVASR